MTDEPHEKLVTKWLISPMEAFFSRMYSAQQRLELANHFGMLTVEQLVGLYEKVIRTCERPPMLASLLTIWERKEAKPAMNESIGHNRGKMPWEQNESEARAIAAEYTRNAMQNDPVWQQALEEGWGFEARAFVDAWAYSQALYLRGGVLIGVNADTMLGCGAGGYEYDDRMREMWQAMKTARIEKVISVPAPSWFVDYGRAKARNRQATLMRTPQSTKQAVADTAEQLTA